MSINTNGMFYMLAILIISALISGCTPAVDNPDMAQITIHGKVGTHSDLDQIPKDILFSMNYVFVHIDLKGMSYLSTSEKHEHMYIAEGQIYPRIVSITKNSTLQIINLDSNKRSHSIIVSGNTIPKRAPLNPPGGYAFQVFEQPESMIRVICLEHPEEVGYVSVYDSPFHATTGEYGEYVIDAILSPGKYNIIVENSQIHVKTTSERKQVTINVVAGINTYNAENIIFTKNP